VAFGLGEQPSGGCGNLASHPGAAVTCGGIRVRRR
jgi:hypothetical protein